MQLGSYYLPNSIVINFKTISVNNFMHNGFNS